jgi:hypothetical protein
VGPGQVDPAPGDSTDAFRVGLASGKREIFLKRPQLLDIKTAIIIITSHTLFIRTGNANYAGENNEISVPP